MEYGTCRMFTLCYRVIPVLDPVSDPIVVCEPGYVSRCINAECTSDPEGTVYGDAVGGVEPRVLQPAGGRLDADAHQDNI
jgi:hypothetical protein